MVLKGREQVRETERELYLSTDIREVKSIRHKQPYPLSHYETSLRESALKKKKKPQSATNQDFPESRERGERESLALIS